MFHIPNIVVKKRVWEERREIKFPAKQKMGKSGKKGEIHLALYVSLKTWSSLIIVF